MHRTTITLVVLSEEPIPEQMDVADIVRECDGDFVLHSTDIVSTKLTDMEMAEALRESGSDPEFFRLEV